MKRSTENDKLIDSLYEVISKKDISFVFLNDNFSKTMVEIALHTLSNIHDLILEYKGSYLNEKSKGEKILLVFGLLQGLFVAVDALYSISKGLKLDKLLISINQNNELRSIKHIRNDVVGHPTFRFYNGDQVGFCKLDIDHITESKFVYQVHTFRKNKEVIEEKEVDLIEIIDQYFIEANNILSQAQNLLDLSDIAEDTMFIDQIVLLFFQYQEGKENYLLLEEIKEGFFRFSHLKKTSRNRVTWRISMIKEAFSHQLTKENEIFIRYLTKTEIRKLYNVTYNLMQLSSKKKNYRKLEVEELTSFRSLKEKINQKPWNIKNEMSILQDMKHPFFEEYMQRIITTFQNDPEVSKLIKWIETVVINKDETFIYMIGSELKKS